MTWLTPMVGAIAAAVAVPTLLILYFLKLRRREIEISTTLLWKKAIQDVQANAPFQKLRRNILLFLQLLALAAACLALAQPMLSGKLATGERHVIVIDRSASMQALDGEDDSGAVTRLEQAKADALRLLDEKLGETGWSLSRSLAAGQSDEAMVVVFDASGEVILPFTSDKGALRAAIESIGPADTPTRAEEAGTLLRAYAPKRQQTEEQPDGSIKVYERPGGRVGTVHIFSDGRIPDFGKTQFGDEDTVLYYPVGKPESANVGITGLQAGRGFKDPTRLSIFVGLQSTFMVERRMDVSIVFEGNVIPPQTQEVVMPAASKGQSASSDGMLSGVTPSTGGTVFKLDWPRAAVATVRITPTGGGAADPLPVDDEASVVIPAAKRLRLALVTRGNLAISQALASLPLSGFDVIAPEAFDQTDLSLYDAVVLDRWLPEMEEGAEDPLPAGRFLVLGTAPMGTTSRPTGLVDEGVKKGVVAQVIDWDREHPVTRSLVLDNVYVQDPRVVRAEGSAGAKVLARSTAGVAIAEVAGLRSRAIVVTFDVAQSTWWRDWSWVVFVGSSARYLGERDSSGLGETVAPGQTLTNKLPEGASEIRFRRPDGEASLVIPNADGTVTVGPVRDVGIHTIEWVGPTGVGDREIDGRAVRPFASNLLDAAESDITVSEKIASSNVELAAESVGEEDRPRRLWPWLLLAVLGIMTFEWWVYNRKVYL